MTPIQSPVWEISYSTHLTTPDRSFLVVLRSDAEPPALALVDASGTINDIPRSSDEELDPIGWLNDHLLATTTTFGFDGVVTVVDRTSADRDVIAPPFPVVPLTRPADGEKGQIVAGDVDALSGHVYYDSALESVVVTRWLGPQPSFAQELWDVDSASMLWSRTSYSPLSRPTWAPDGAAFATVIGAPPAEDAIASTLCMVSTKGKESRLAAGVHGQLAWSPDGRFLAGYWQPDTSISSHDRGERRSRPAIVNLATREVVVYSIPEVFTRIGSYPIWSPDGRYVVYDHVLQVDALTDLHRTIVIDLLENKAYRLSGNGMALSWLAPLEPAPDG